MTKKLRAFGLALAVIGLYACNQEDKTATGASEANGTGNAVIRLPAVPQEYLAKAAPAAKVGFALTITGDGMAPLRKDWSLVPGQAESLSVSGIPAGYLRIFTGQLYRLDSAGHDTVFTHEGSDSADIERDKTAEVHLYLRKKGDGSAHVCVDVEGWASDSTCIPPPHPVPTYVAGCWHVEISKPGATPKLDTVFTGTLRIGQEDTSLSGVLTWKSGAKDTGYGKVLYQSVIGFGAPYAKGSRFHFKASVDSMNTTFEGVFDDSARHISGNLRATRIPCDTLVFPPVDTVKSCYDVAQSLKMGKSASGRLAFLAIGHSVRGGFLWNGFPRMTVFGTLNGAPKDTSFLDLTGIAPKGMVDVTGKTVDTLEYRALIPADPKASFAGNVFQLLPTGLQPDGNWKATPTACTAKDSVP